jgi:hypothetical protein
MFDARNLSYHGPIDESNPLQKAGRTYRKQPQEGWRARANGTPGPRAYSKDIKTGQITPLDMITPGYGRYYTTLDPG